MTEWTDAEDGGTVWSDQETGGAAITAFMRTLLDDASAAAARGTLDVPSNTEMSAAIAEHTGDSDGAHASSAISFTQSGSDSIARDLQSKAREILSVADKDSGASDKAAAFTAACADARTVIVPKAGSPWVLDSEVTVPANTRIVVEAGATFSTTKSAGTLPTRFFKVTGSNVEFDGLKWTLSSTPANFGTPVVNGFGIEIVGNNIENVRIKGNCDLRYFSSCVRQSTSYSGLKNLVIEDGATFVGTFIDIDLHGTACESIRIGKTRHPVDRDWGASVTRMAACISIVPGFEQNGSKVTFSDANYANDCNEDVVVDGAYLYRPDRWCIFVFNSKAVRVVNTRIEARAGGGVNGRGYSNDAIVLDLCRGFTVSGNQITDSGENGIDVLSSQDGTVFGNTGKNLQTIGVVFDMTHVWYDDTAVTVTGDTHSNTTVDGIADTSDLVEGQSISGNGIVSGTKIESVDSSTAITLSIAATATASGVTLTQGALPNVTDRLSLIPRHVKVFGNVLHAHYPVQIKLGQHLSIDDNTLLHFKDSINRLYQVQTGTTTSGSAVVTGLSDTSLLKPGAAVSGTGIPASTEILSIDSATQVTLNANATATGSPSLTFGSSTIIPNLYSFSQTGLLAFYTESTEHRALNIEFNNNKRKVGPEYVVTADNTTDTFTTTYPHDFETGDVVEFLAKHSASSQTFPTRATFTFTGDTNTSASLTNVSSTTNLEPGQAISGTDIPAGTFIKSISGTTITMSAAATGTSVGVTVTVTPVLYGTYYYAIKTGEKTFQIATTYANAQLGTEVDIATDGTGIVGVREFPKDLAWSTGSNATSYTSMTGNVKLDPKIPMLAYAGGFAGVNGVLTLPPISGARAELVLNPGTAYTSSAKANSPMAVDIPPYYDNATDSYGSRPRTEIAGGQTWEIGNNSMRYAAADRATTEFVRVWVW